MEPILLNLNEKLIWNFLFSEKTEYELSIEKYCLDGERADFRDRMRGIIKMGGKQIMEDRMIHTEQRIIWKLEIK